MDADLSTTLIASRTAATHQSVAIAVAKKTNEMQIAMIEQVAETARAAPPPGQGNVVDKVA